MKKVLITTGDPDGIGFEISAKAFYKIGPKSNVQFFYYFNEACEKKYLKLIEKKFKIVKAYSLSEALALDLKKNQIIQISCTKNPALCFEDAVIAAKEKKLDAIVTAPLSKELIEQSGLSDRGHTDIIRRLVNQDQNIYMAFIGEYFSLMLVTDHIMLKDVAAKVTKETLSDILKTGARFFDLLKTPKSKRKIGVLGLNPHAGEIKNLGFEERNMIFPAIQEAQRNGLNVHGPLVADVAFQSPHYKKYPLFIAMYHDQGLIPFKMLHKKNHGVQISLNTPFVRVSVDHGCAKDIFGKNKADASSMIRAIQTALKIV